MIIGPMKILVIEDDVEECTRRSLSDVGMFDGVEDEVDYVLENPNYTLTPEEIADIIYYKAKEREVWTI